MAKNHIGFNRRVFNLKSSVPNLIFKTIIFAIAAYALKDDFPFLLTIFWIYVSFNFMLLIGFWAFKRFINKKIGEVNNQFQGNISQQDEDLGEAEIVED